MRAVWPQVALLLAALLWWPVGFAGVTSWLHLPLSVFDGDVLFLGAAAAAASVSLLVRSPWPRLAIVLVFSGLGWLLDAPATDDYPHERAVLAALLGAAALLGILLGARGSKGPVAAGSVVAVVAGLTPATWPTEAAVAVALALPFAVATWHRVAPTILAVVRLAVTWLLFALLARALAYGWDVVRPGAGGLSLRDQARRVAEPAWDFARTQWWTWSEIRLRGAGALALADCRGGRGASRRGPGRGCAPSRDGDGAQHTVARGTGHPGRSPAVGDVDDETARRPVLDGEGAERQPRPGAHHHRRVAVVRATPGDLAYRREASHVHQLAGVGRCALGPLHAR